MYSPVTLGRIIKAGGVARNYSVQSKGYLDVIQNWFVSSSPNPLGRWCHEESDIYKKTCKPYIKNSLANLDNSYQHNDAFDVVSHLEMHNEFKDRNKIT